MTIFLSTLALCLALAAAAVSMFRPLPIAAIYLGAATFFVIHAPGTQVQPFTWIKLASLVPLIFLMAALPKLEGRARAYAGGVVVAVIALNVLEAVVQAAVHQDWLNAALGALLLATQPGLAATGVREAGGRRSWVYGLTPPWIAAYVTWNLGFVAAMYPDRTADHVAVLLAPLVAAAWRRDLGTFAEARAFTLSLYCMGVVAWLDALHRPWLPDAPPTGPVYLGILAAAIAASLWNAASWIRGRRAPSPGPGEVAV